METRTTAPSTLRDRVQARRSKIPVNAKQTSYNKFEKTINILLSSFVNINGFKFELQTDMNQMDPIRTSQNFSKIETKMRKNGSISRPDAILTQVNKLKDQNLTFLLQNDSK